MYTIVLDLCLSHLIEERTFPMLWLSCVNGFVVREFMVEGDTQYFAMRVQTVHV